MGKYYVQSGTLRTVVHAESGRKAAIWAVHQALQQIFPLEAGESTRSIRDVPARQDLSVLATTVDVSERGFDRPDAHRLRTLEVVTEWNQLILTLDRLERMLYREVDSPVC